MHKATIANSPLPDLALLSGGHERLSLSLCFAVEDFAPAGLPAPDRSLAPF